MKAPSPGVRANCWSLAEAAGHEGWGRLQALLRSYRWDWRDLRAALPGLAAGAQAEAIAGLVTRCGGQVFADVSPSRGRHVYVLFAEPLPWLERVPWVPRLGGRAPLSPELDRER